MSAIAIQSDQQLIDSLTELRNIIKDPKTPKTHKINDLRVMNSFLTKISNEQRSSVVTSFALDIVNNDIANRQRLNKAIPPDLKIKRDNLTSNLIRSTQRETLAAAAAAAAATNAARCTGRGCFSRFTRSIKRKIGLHTTPTPPTSPIVSPYNPQPAIEPFRRTSKSHGQSRTYNDIPKMPLGGSRRVRRRTKHGQRVKHRRRTVRRLF